MDHKTFVTTLSAEITADLNALDDRAGLRHLALHSGLICTLATWVALGWPFWWAALMPLGIATCFLFTLQHECTHRTPFRTPWINEAVGQAVGVLILQPFEWFRYFHLAHHKFTNDPARDPELLSGAKPETWQAFLWHVSGLPTWAALLAQTVQNARSRNTAPYIPDRARPRIAKEARLLLVIYAAACTSLLFTPLLFWIWILPCLLGQPFLRLYLLAEHGRCAFVADMFQNTRTTFTNRIIRYLAWNMPYHVEHHSLPQVPFHKLPLLHAHMKGHHRVTAQGYAAFTRAYTQTLREADTR